VKLVPEDHARDFEGLRYVYPVVSRRAEGVSVGINLNPNNACNWRCVYCQVKGLVRGKAPAIDLAELERELRSVLHLAADEAWLAKNVAPEVRRLNDVAFSGNGEPSSSPQFAAAIELAGRVRSELGLAPRVKLIVISNGSLVHKHEVERGLSALARAGGELWFKLDSATEVGLRAINDAAPGLARVRANLARACELVPTWIQTCMFERAGLPPSELEETALLAFLRAHLARSRPPRGLLLYGLARPSHQPEASELGRLPREWLEAFAERTRALGLDTRVFP
jgi:wyosine [tRNA(Phe)-imidazoG37] synthetase (radical SAM superfamily)